jgi:hypothetical protein
VVQRTRRRRSAPDAGRLQDRGRQGRLAALKKSRLSSGMTAETGKFSRVRCHGHHIL